MSKPCPPPKENWIFKNIFNKEMNGFLTHIYFSREIKEFFSRWKISFSGPVCVLMFVGRHLGSSVVLERIRTKTEPEETSFIVRLLLKVAQNSFNH